VTGSAGGPRIARSVRSASSFELRHEHLGTVYDLSAPLEKPLRGLTRLFHSLAQMLWKQRTGSEMRAKFGEVVRLYKRPYVRLSKRSEPSCSCRKLFEHAGHAATTWSKQKT